MNVLVITASEPPHPHGGQHGSQMRTRTFMRALGQMMADVEVIYYVVDPECLDPSVQEAIRTDFDIKYWGVSIRRHFLKISKRNTNFYNEYVKGIISVCDQPELYSRAGGGIPQNISDILKKNYDLIIVRSLAPMMALLPALKNITSKVIFDIDDVQHLVRWRWAFTPPVYLGKLLKLAQLPALFAGEYRAALRSACTIVCSESDSDSLRRSGFPRVTALANTLKLPEYLSRLTESPNLMFIGLAHYEPNAQAIERMVTRIFPLVKSQRPMVRMYIGGESSDELNGLWSNDESIEYLGFVPNLDMLYANTRVFVCPIINGGGTRLKLIEAAARGVPIVSSTVGAEGLAFSDGDDILIRDDDEAFAKACIDLIDDSQKCESLRKHARSKVETLYDEKNATAQIRRLVEFTINS